MKNYGKIGCDICTITAWADGKHFTLHPLGGALPHIGLLEGQFTRYSEAENAIVHEALGTIARKHVQDIVNGVVAI